MSRMSARLPPTVRWMFTAITTNPKLYDFMRWAIASRACSDCMPSWVSASTRENSFGGRLGALVDGALDRLVERVAGLQRRCHRDQRLGQLVLEPLQPLLRLEPDEEHRDDESERQRDQRRDAGVAQHQGDERAEQQRRCRSGCRTARPCAAAGRPARATPTSAATSSSTPMIFSVATNSCWRRPSRMASRWRRRPVRPSSGAPCSGSMRLPMITRRLGRHQHQRRQQDEQRGQHGRAPGARRRRVGRGSLPGPSTAARRCRAP